MRLIDVDEITDREIVKYLGKEYGFCVPDVRDLLKDQPTAYNVDKVVRELEYYAEECRKTARSFEEAEMWKSSSKMYAKAYSYEAAICIVKRGGIDV